MSLPPDLLMDSGERQTDAEDTGMQVSREWND